MKYEVTLSTVASLTVVVDSDDEEAAIDEAYDRARGVSSLYLPIPEGSFDLNEEWQFEEPTVRVKEGESWVCTSGRS